MYEKIPEELKRSGLFCRWKLELSSKGKPTKMPYAMSGAKARSTVKADFANFRLVVANLDGFDGIGLGIFDGFNAIDIDDCVADGKMSEMAQAVVDTMNSYTEVSPSGTGIRIIFKAKDLTFDRKRYYINNQKAHLEVYIAGATNKYVTLTGNALNDLGVEERSEEIKQVLEQFMVRPEVKVEQAKVKATGSYLTDESVVAKAMASKQGAKFSALWNGEVPDGKSPSEADIALANMLAFWCGGDIEQMDRLFRASGLMRDKWDEHRGDKTYGRLTLEKAVAQTNDFYTPLPHSSPADDFDVVMEKLEQLHPEANPRYVWDDLGSGRLFADIYCSIARYVPERKCWYTYDGKRWVQDVGSMLTMELCKDLADRLWIYACGIKDERLRGSYMRTHYKSYKNHTVVEVPKEDWLVFENTHEPIIDRETWETVQRIRNGRRRNMSYDTPNPFAGILYCADCGNKMYLCRAKTMEEAKYHYVCATYRKRKGECKSHQVYLNMLQQMVLEKINGICEYVKNHEDEFVQMVTKKAKKESASMVRIQEQELGKATKRITQIDTIIQKLYEDNVMGKISEDRYSRMSAALEEEQTGLNEKVSELKDLLAEQENQSVNMQQFLDKVHRYTDIKVLDVKIINEFIEKIYVYHPEKINGQKTQRIRIVFNCIGEFDLPNANK